jgi:hypothetical protein
MAFPFAAVAAGSLLGGLLGGKGQKTSSDISPEGQDFRNWYMRRLQGQTGMPMQFYGLGDYKAGGGNRFTPPPTFDAGQDPWVASLGNLWGNNGYVNQFLNPYQQHMETAMGRTFGRQRDALGQQVADLATRERAFGGTRSIVAQRLGERDINESEADALAKLNYQGYQDALGYGLQERGIQQGQRQNEIDAARQRFEMAQMWPMMQLDRFGQGFSGMPWGQTSQQGGGLGGFLSGALGGGLSAYGMFGGGGGLAPRPAGMMSFMSGSTYGPGGPFIRNIPPFQR